MLRQYFNFRIYRAALNLDGNPKIYIFNYLPFECLLVAYMLAVSTAQNRGAIGSMTFLFVVQIESHSRETTACEGP